MLKKENDYFKDALKMLSPITSATVDNIKTNLLYVGVPVKVTVQFSNIPPSVLYLKRVTLAFNYYDRNKRLQSAKPFFTDLKVDWQ